MGYNPKAPFTRYRFHFISDWVRQSDMKISPIYTMPFSFHSGLVSCHFQSVFIRKRENGMTHIGLVRSRGYRRPIRYGMKTVSCSQKANPI